MLVTAGLLPLLRVQPEIGRRFTEQDDSPGAPQTIMLSYAYWRRQFGADSAVVGSTLRVNGTQREIIGVLPPVFLLPPAQTLAGQDVAIYLPFQWDRAVAVRGGFDSPAIARLLPGATIEQADTDMERMIPIWLERFPGGLTLAILEEIQFVPNVRPLKEDFVGDIGKILWVLLGTVGIPTWLEIVGVVGDVHDDGVSQPAPPVSFSPMARNGPDSLLVQRSMAFAVRTSRPTASSILPEVRAGDLGRKSQPPASPSPDARRNPRPVHGADVVHARHTRHRRRSGPRTRRSRGLRRYLVHRESTHSRNRGANGAGSRP